MIQLNDVQHIFNRAFSLTFDKKKWGMMFCVLALCGLLIVFFRALSIQAGPWLLMSLSFLPIFLCGGLLLSAGIILTRIYHDEIKRKPVKYLDILAKSWEVVLGASYFSIPMILCYLLLWMLLGFFVLLKEIPGVGEFFSALLAFGPFLINFGSLILGLFNLAMLFLLTPVIALNGLNRMRIAHILKKRLSEDIFSNVLLAFIALIPLCFFLGLLLLSVFLTDSLCFTCENPLHAVIQLFFIMIPFVGLLAPWVVFFFNFAAEAHVLIQRQTSHLP